MTRSLTLRLLLLSAATLTFEITLSRLFAVAQFYHFAFMVVSVALLGFGASGTVLTLSPRLSRTDPHRALPLLSLATALTILASYLLINFLPFDSFRVAWDRSQLAVLALHYLALAAPFFFGGMTVALLLRAFPNQAGRTYAVNLLGSALGCLLALAAPTPFGGEGTLVLSAALALLAVPGRPIRRPLNLLSVPFLTLTLLELVLRASALPSLLPDLRLSPYKSLSYALRYPDAEVLYRRWNAFSRVDVVRSASIHSIPGLSYRYLASLPPQDALFVDGDDPSVILPPDTHPDLFSYLPTSVAYRLRPEARSLILEPRGGLDVVTALALGARQVTVTEVNPLIVQAVGPLYRDPRLHLALEADRSYLRRARGETYDIIVLSLTASYHPVGSGAYSLGEEYRYTVEAFEDALSHLAPGGLFVVTRWLQETPSESLRAFALAVTALERSGADPAQQIVAFRGYQTMTLLVRNGPFTPAELQTLRDFLAGRAFDLVYAPDLHLEETNRYNVLPQAIYAQAYRALLTARPREAFYKAYPYDVRPPTDDRPFFGHYFKWSQAPQVLAELGKTMQPFGGAGYFVILALLVLALLAAGVLILLPVMVRARDTFSPKPAAYFALIGLAYLFVEIPLIQRFILFLGNPAYAFTAVLFTLLLSSGLGSQRSERLPFRLALGGLVVLLLVAPLLLPPLFARMLGWPLTLRLSATVLLLAPIGFFMGIPFPAGLRWVTRQESDEKIIPWVWAVNGAASVVAAILAALLALTVGFGWVLRLGALCYAGAWLTAGASPDRRLSPPPHP
ncbi:MAG: hypothetical protein D6770_04215 [Anaerolineae bacterium]|nr:MAG: hypothetical protein D6770_04215 [Anaerolineae bacterium]